MEIETSAVMKAGTILGLLGVQRCTERQWNILLGMLEVGSQFVDLAAFDQLRLDYNRLTEEREHLRGVIAGHRSELEKLNHATLQPIETAPRDLYIILMGDSGYTTTPWRAEVGRWCPHREAWITHSNDRYSDGGGVPTHWLPLPIVKDETRQS